ncbi:ESCRT-I component [Phyllosticta citrichinensis]|uniref:ESCRT-I component n=1 Tax=Phyllosticta citrichinensis TaxID=1130410 RepID=A0ABR1XGU9_9PEZI
MPPVNDRVLNWLYSVLTNEYTDVNRTYNDAAEALAQYPSLSPKTEVYTYENGTPALLLLLSGTIPVQFRGAVYRFPIALWVPHAYPREPPLVYVTPNQDMLVRPGQHVSSDGRVYHPYLSGWSQHWDKSSIADFLTVLRGVFAKEPPVVAKSQGYSSPPRQQQPPPVPPTPEEWRRQMQPQAIPSPAPQHQPTPPPPPPPPPKPPKDTSLSNGQASANGYSQPPPTGPPVPPLPPQIVSQNGGSGYGSPPIPHQFPPHTQGPAQAQPRPQYVYPPRPSPIGRDSPVSPISPGGTPGDPPARYSRPPLLPGQDVASQASPAPPTYSAPPPPPPPQTYPNQPPNFASPPYQQPPQPQFPPPVTSAPAPAAPAPKPPALDLLTSPLDVTLPSQDPSSNALPAAPPIPPNPQKDALLTALSSHLRTLTSQTVSANLSALPPLRAQHAALVAAYSRLQSERGNLASLSATLTSNAAVLDGAMREADRVIADTHGRAVPDVDEVLVAPTVAASQLWRLVAEERACGEAVHVLGKALDQGRVGADVFAKQVRAIAREAFLKKVVIRKIARGLGLDEGGGNAVRGGGVGVGVGVGGDAAYYGAR